MQKLFQFLIYIMLQYFLKTHRNKIKYNLTSVFLDVAIIGTRVSGSLHIPHSSTMHCPYSKFESNSPGCILNQHFYLMIAKIRS